jgi:hypothetical protein
MFSNNRPFDLLRSLLYLSLLGFAVLLLSGPVLAVAGILLPFALIGGLTWAGYRVSHNLVRRLRGEQARPIFEEVKAIPSPAPVLYRPVVAERPAPRKPSRLASLLGSALRIGIETACGAILGAALGVVAWQYGGGTVEFVLFGTAIGAVVGFVVGGSGTQNKAEAIEDKRGATTHAA